MENESNNFNYEIVENNKDNQVIIDIAKSFSEKLLRLNLSDYNLSFHLNNFKVFKDNDLIIDKDCLNNNSNGEFNHQFLQNKNKKIKDSNSYNHNISNILLEESLSKQIDDEVILIFSPHQDDEVLGCGALIHKLKDLNFKIIYLTSGKGGGDSLVRKQEAINGIKILTGKNDVCEFWDLPFYDNEKRDSSVDDFVYINKKFSEFRKISNLFICSDLNDPNRTHLRCFNILFNFLKLKFQNTEAPFNDNLLNIDNLIRSINNLNVISKQELSGVNFPFNIYLFFSVWYDPLLSEITHYISYNKSIYSLKVKAMLEHLSQLKNNHMGSDTTPFYVRATMRDEQYYFKINKNYKIDLHQNNDNNLDSYCEVFHKVYP